MGDTKVFVKKYESCLSDIQSAGVATRMERLGVPEYNQKQTLKFSMDKFIDELEFY
jgi:hypothetical protein